MYVRADKRHKIHKRKPLTGKYFGKAIFESINLLCVLYVGICFQRGKGKKMNKEKERVSERKKE